LISTVGLKLTDVAYERLRKLIQQGEFLPGSLIRETELTSRFEMSRTPIREALQRLQAEGLLVPGQRGYIVVDLTREDVRDVYQVRAMLEGTAARWAARRRSRTDIAQMLDLLDDMDAALARDDEESLAELNGLFHEALGRASGNNYLLSMLSATRKFAEGGIRKMAREHPERPAQSVVEHRALVDAIIAGDEDAAEKAARFHVVHHVEVRLGLKLTE
jgi:DNA-binding GntR family transcriptional regulator